MKTFLISAILAIYACVNPTEKNQADHIVLPTIENQQEVAPDTFILVGSEELKIDPKPTLESKELIETSSASENQVNKNEELEKSDIAPIESTPNQTPSSVNEKGEKNNTGKEQITPVVIETINSSTTEESRANESSEVKETPTLESKEIVTETKLGTEESVNEQSVEVTAVALVLTPDHSIFNELLKSYVSNSGNVNYKGIKSSEAKLDNYLSELDKNAPKSDWSKNEQLAYWMNAYNAFTIKLILNNYPVSKITDLHGGKPWDVKWINLGGKTYSLNNIEHDIIRPTYKDPRIHFAVNCAAKSCPPLLNKAYTAENVNRLLNNVTKAFVNSSSNEINSNAVQLSKIFEWYAGDFGNIIKFLNQYSAKKIDSDAKVGYLDYNWSLNEG